MEEVWGEVDHSINYPHKTESLPCREQIKALARATSSCSRLVDSIFTSFDDYHDKIHIRNHPPISPLVKKTKKNSKVRYANPSKTGTPKKK